MENDEITRLQKIISGYQFRLNNLSNQYTYVLNALNDCQEKYELLQNDFSNLEKKCENLENSQPKEKSLKKSKSHGELQENNLPLSKSPTLADISSFDDLSGEDLSLELSNALDFSDMPVSDIDKVSKTKTLVEGSPIFGESEDYTSPPISQPSQSTDGTEDDNKPFFQEVRFKREKRGGGMKKYIKDSTEDSSEDSSDEEFFYY